MPGKQIEQFPVPSFLNTKGWAYADAASFTLLLYGQMDVNTVRLCTNTDLFYRMS